MEGLHHIVVTLGGKYENRCSGHMPDGHSARLHGRQMVGKDDGKEILEFSLLCP